MSKLTDVVQSGLFLVAAGVALFVSWRVGLLIFLIDLVVGSLRARWERLND